MVNIDAFAEWQALADLAVANGLLHPSFGSDWNEEEAPKPEGSGLDPWEDSWI